MNRISPALRPPTFRLDAAREGGLSAFGGGAHADGQLGAATHPRQHRGRKGGHLEGQGRRKERVMVDCIFQFHYLHEMGHFLMENGSLVDKNTYCIMATVAQRQSAIYD